MGHHGNVYIARNDKHPENVYKIGGSARDVNARMAELNRETATFGKFKPKAFFPVTDWEQAEAKCHRSLSEFREDKKEFFTAPYEQLLKTVRGICEEYAPKVYAQEPEENASEHQLEKNATDQNLNPNLGATDPFLGEELKQRHTNKESKSYDKDFWMKWIGLAILFGAWPVIASIIKVLGK